MDTDVLIFIIVAGIVMLCAVATLTAYIIDDCEQSQDGTPYRHWRELL